MSASTRRKAGAIVFSLALLAPAAAHGATYAVDRVDDDGAANACTGAANDCSLRGAIDKANMDVAADTITVPNGTYSVTTALPDITEELTIDGASASATIIDGANTAATLLSNDADAIVQDIRMRNSAVGAGFSGAVVQNTGALTMRRVVVIDNRSTGFSNNGNSMIIEDSLIARNSSALVGGGLSAGTGFFALRRSTVTDNTATDVVPGTPLALAGGVVVTCIATIEDSTIVRNRAVRTTGSALAGNLLTIDVGTGCPTLVTARNTIVAKGLADGAPSDCIAPDLTTAGFNLDSDSSCNFTRSTDIPGVDPLVGPLAANGGPTPTVALLQGSPAIDTGGACAGTDQRGTARPAGGACDIGAFESPFTKPAPTPPAPPAPPAPAAPTVVTVPGPPVAATGAPTVPADTTAPTVSLLGVGSTIKRATFRRALKGRVRLSEPASVEIAILGTTRRATLAKAGDLVLGTRTLARAGGTRAFSVKPSARLVPRRGKRFKATLVVTATDAAGNRKVTRKTITVK